MSNLAQSVNYLTNSAWKGVRYLDKMLLLSTGINSNNNCLGCTKGGMGYWNRIRKDFPEVFERRARLERQVGYAILKDSKGHPVYLDELEPTRGNMNTEIFPDCGIMCYLSMEE